MGAFVVAENVVTVDGCQGFKLPVRIVAGVVVVCGLNWKVLARDALFSRVGVTYECVFTINMLDDDDGELPSRE